MTTPAPKGTTLKSSNGFYLGAVNGGGAGVNCDAEVVGPWEQWIVHTHDDGRVSLQAASTALYLTAAPDGTVECRATEASEWERFDIEVRDVGVAFLSAHDTYLQAQEGGGNPLPVRVVGDDPNLPGEWEFFESSTAFWEEPKPLNPTCTRPLIGPLAIQDDMFRDDSGWRRTLFCSWFPALRILRDNPEEFYRQLDAIAVAGFQGIRVFLAVGGWTDYWDGREVVPKTFTKWVFTGNHLRTDTYGPTIEAWPDYDDLLRTLLRECLTRKLRLHVTCGDMQIICPDSNEEIDLHRHFATICAEEGGTEVIALAECTNEFPLNRAGGDSTESIEQMGRVLDVWTETIPGVLTAQGAIPGNEEPESLEKASTYGPICVSHTSRDPFSMCIKRTFGLVYYEGDYRGFGKPFWQGEPAGPGEDSYCRQDDPANLTALYAIHALTGQHSNWFQGAGVRSYAPLESEWGFDVIAKLFAEHLPEDITHWDHGSNQHGGIEYWWKGNDFRSATYVDWDPTPPRPIATWTLYTGTGSTSGTGTPPQKSTGLLVGTFA